MKKTNILASLTIAQAILESGWGLSGLTARSNNLFGIKGTSITSTTFEYINGKRVEIVDGFKVYPDWETSIADHSGLFLRLSRYMNLRGCKDYKVACRNVQSDGYATAPKYADSLISIIEQFKLYEYDRVEVKSKFYKISFICSQKHECESIQSWVKSHANYIGSVEEI